jgi:hypothetical protein
MLLSNINGNGNYVLNIIGNSIYETDGITLLIIYRDPFATYQGSLIIHDGIITEIGNSSFSTVDNFTACDSSSFGTGFTITSDYAGQCFTSQS